MALREVARLRPIYGDTDQMGFVYYANYLRYFELARTEWLRAAGFTYRSFEDDHGLVLPVVEANVRYRKPARYDDQLVIRAGIGEIGAASARFDYEIVRLPDGEVVADGFTRHACITRAGRIARLPEAMRVILAP